MRLDRYIASQTAYSRSHAGRLVLSGRVSVDGAVVRDRGHGLDPTTARVAIDGRELTWTAEITLLMHKPAGVICATHDRQHRTVLELVPPRLRRDGLAPAGRLDKDTTGLLVLTTDGALNHAITHPRRHVARRYRAEVEGDLLDRPPDEVVAAFAAGIRLADGTVCKPAELHWVGPGVAHITLHEGRYHQVRRMVAACGGRVLRLHREAIGALPLPEDLGPGEVRVATKAELDAALSREEKA